MVIETKLQKDLEINPVGKQATLQTKDGYHKGTVIFYNKITGNTQIEFSELEHKDLDNKDLRIFIGKVDYINPKPHKEETDNPALKEIEEELDYNWEYTSLKNSFLCSLIEEANGLGKEGWEMVNFIYHSDKVEFLAIFKRIKTLNA